MTNETNTNKKEYYTFWYNGKNKIPFGVAHGQEELQITINIFKKQKSKVKCSLLVYEAKKDLSLKFIKEVFK